MAIERAEGQMTSLSCDLEDQTVRKTERRTLSKTFDRSGDSVRILKGQLLMIEQHLDRGGDRLRAAIVNGCQDPGGFSENEMGHPRTPRDKGLGSRDLSGIIARHEPDEDVRVNGSHVAS
jgi:hypothetical protein